jgi:hypothetical protein
VIEKPTCIFTTKHRRSGLQGCEKRLKLSRFEELGEND